MKHTSKISPKIIISGGGTGGHIYPAIAIANEIKLRLPDAEILFVGAKDRMEMQKVPKAGYAIKGLPVQGFKRGNLLGNFGVLRNLLKSLQLAKKIVNDFKPHAAIGTGGYASGPLLHTAAKNGIPIFIQEQNAHPGITNKLLAKKATQIFTAYPDIKKFPKEKVVETGNPTRTDLYGNLPHSAEAKKSLGFDSNKPLILNVGGSLGSKTMNEAWKNGYQEVIHNDFQLFWQTGEQHLHHYQTEINEHENIQLTDFIYDMRIAYAAADVIVSRAGAMAISELCLVGKPVILLPFPFAAEDHQTKNAEQLVKANAAKMIRDKQAPDHLVKTTMELLKNEDERKQMAENILAFAKPNATKEIVDQILKHLQA